MVHKDKRTLSMPVMREFLNKDFCNMEADLIISNDLIRGMTRFQLASELYSHACAYYFSRNKKLLSLIMNRADPIDLCDGGDKPFRRLMFALMWMLPVRRSKKLWRSIKTSIKKKIKKLKKYTTA